MRTSIVVGMIMILAAVAPRLPLITSFLIGVAIVVAAIGLISNYLER